MGGSSPCASCKLLRRRCAKDCIFSPYFPSDDPQRFAIVHKVFGASNVGKMLQELPDLQRSDAANSLVFEANARVRDPVYGCVGAISYLQKQVSELQMQLAVAQAEILCIQIQQNQKKTSPTAGDIDDESSLVPSQISHIDLHEDKSCSPPLLISSTSSSICSNSFSSINYHHNHNYYYNNDSSSNFCCHLQQYPDDFSPSPNLKLESLWT